MNNSLWQQIQNTLHITPDGIPGNKTFQAVTQKLFPQTIFHNWADLQSLWGITNDNKPGIETAQITWLALAKKNKKCRLIFPLEHDVPSFFGQPGKHLTTITVPYSLRLAWEPTTTTKRFTCHQLIAPLILQIFSEILAHYGEDQIEKLGLNLFGGCFNNRTKINGTNKSMHAYGIAVDLDPEHNDLHSSSKNARFAQPEYTPFWQIIEKQGGISLGRTKNYDWMHFQFARIR